MMERSSKLTGPSSSVTRQPGRDRISFLHLPRTSISLSAMPPRKHNDMDIDSGDDAYLTDGDDDDYSMGKTKKGKGKASEKRASGKGKGKGASGDVSS